MAMRPLPMAMTPRSGGAPPALPGSPVGGPGGPGSSPMVSPGQSSGVKASAAARIKAAMRIIQIAGLSFDPGSKEFNAVMGSLRTLNGVFGKPSDADLDPAARAQMAQPPQNPLAGMAPAGAQPGGGIPPPQGGPPASPPTPPPGGGGGEMGMPAPM